MKPFPAVSAPVRRGDPAWQGEECEDRPMRRIAGIARRNRKSAGADEGGSGV